MKYDLYDYQELAKQVVVRTLISMDRSFQSDPSDTGAVVLAAPTGAGKTVIATAVIEAALDGDSNTPGIEGATFLWVTDDPSLNNQTLHKMVAASSALSLNRLCTIENDFDQEVFDSGSVYFLNIQKLSANAALAKGGTDARSFSLWDTIANTVKQRPEGFVVVIDEAHRGMGTARSTRDTIVSQIIGGGTTDRPTVPIVWGISATPKRFRDQMNDRERTVKTHAVAIEDVRSSGLLKDQIVLGHTGGQDAAETTLVRHAVAKVRDYEARWDTYCHGTHEPKVEPVLVVQVEDKPTPKLLGEIVDTILDEWPGLTAANVVHVFGTRSTARAGGHTIRWCPPEDVQDRADVRVVLCMTAITTGWDCPRAEVLVSLRVAKDEALITQIMGRMVRTPLARRVELDVTLNAVHCILPKFDEKAVDSIAAQFEKGDDGIAGGTEVITVEVELARNPTFTKPMFHPQSAEDQDKKSDETAEDTSWFGPEETPDTEPPRSTKIDTRPVPVKTAGIRQDGPDLLTVEPVELDVVDQVDASAPSDVFAVLESLPSYTVPSRAPGSAISRAFRLGALLSYKYGDTALEPAARKLVLNALLGEMDTFRADLDARGELSTRLERVANTPLFERVVTYGSPTMYPETNSSSQLALDDRGIRILLARARRALPEGLVDEYIARRAPGDDDVSEAMILAIALAQDTALPGRVEARAADLVSSWLKHYHSAITRLPEVAREDFDRVRRQSSRPEITTFRIPPRENGDRQGQSWDRHVLSDVDGKYRCHLKDMEAHVLQTELDHGAIAWYRNPPNRAKNALVIPWQKWDGWHGLYVDFLFVHEVSGRLRPSIVDPHGAYMGDAVGKLRGVAAYVEGHADVYHRVQVVDLIGGQYRMLDLLDPSVRGAILAYKGNDSDDAAELYAVHGTNY